ncbi:uncharacterized protein [Dysidea avara]|uniref:uncharacterized protein n=1 Tax=Dysidea avara TaxID=196820 RepID=UPI00331BAC0C
MLSYILARTTGRKQYDEFGSFAEPDEYESPPYLINSARRKYGEGILLIGALENEIKNFWRNVEVKASNSDYQDEPPQEVTRQIVDISAKEHGTEEDEVDIFTNEEETRTEQKSYSLSFEKSWEFGGTIDVGASFFNAFGAGGASLAPFLLHLIQSGLEDQSNEERKRLKNQRGMKSVPFHSNTV